MNELSERNPEPQQHRGYRSFFWPIILIGVGVVWLLVNLGLVQAVALNNLLRFWPVILILIGVDIIFRRYSLIGALLGLLTVGLVVVVLLFGGSWLANAPGINFPFSTFSNQDIKSQKYSEPLGDTRSAKVQLNLNRWRTTVTALNDSASLAEADVDYVGTFDFNVQGSQEKTLTIGQSGISGVLIGNINDSQYRWDIGLSPNIPLELEVNTASGSNELQLTDLQLTRVTIEGASGSSKVALPATAQPLPVTIRSHSGSFNFSMPNQSNANLDMTGGSGSIQFSLGDQSNLTMRWHGASGSQTIDIGSGAMLDARLDSGSGSVTINLPSDAAVRIEVQNAGSGAVSISSRLQRKSGSGKTGVWESSDYSTAKRRITIVLSSGSGSVSVH